MKIETRETGLVINDDLKIIFDGNSYIIESISNRKIRVDKNV